MDLRAAVQRLGEGLTAAEIVSILDVTVSLSFNTERWTYAGVAVAFGAAAAEALGAAMRSAGLVTAAEVYAVAGFDLSLDLIQGQLDQLAAGFNSQEMPQLAEVCQQLKMIGRPTKKRWAIFELPALPTEQEVQAVLDELADASWADLVLNSILMPVIRGEKTKAQAITEIQAS